MAWKEALLTKRQYHTTYIYHDKKTYSKLFNLNRFGIEQSIWVSVFRGKNREIDRINLSICILDTILARRTRTVQPIQHCKTCKHMTFYGYTWLKFYTNCSRHGELCVGNFFVRIENINSSILLFIPIFCMSYDWPYHNLTMSNGMCC